MVRIQISQGEALLRWNCIFCKNSLRYWQQYFREGWFDILKQCESIPEVSNDYVGAMHITDNGKCWKFFERYNCPRFTEPDEKGDMILDICAYLV